MGTTGKNKLHVYKDYDGIVRKYIIPEDTYKSEEEDDCTTNADLDSTAYVDGVIEGSSSVSAYADVDSDTRYRDAEKDGLDLSRFITEEEETSFDPENAVVPKDRSGKVSGKQDRTL